VQGVLSAEPAVLVHFKPVRIVLLVFHRVVVALFALCACKCDFNSHNGTSRFTEIFFLFPKNFFNLSKKDRLPQNALFPYCTFRHILRQKESTIQYGVQSG